MSMAARRLFFDMFRMTVAVIWGLLSMKGVSAGITYPVRWAVPFRIEGLNQDGFPPGIHAVRLEAGDSIRFEYDHSKDDLLEVGSNGFIDRGPPIQKWKDGNTTITFSTPGQFYYTCSLLHRHLAGQFLTVFVRDYNIPPEPSSEAPIESPLPSNTVYKSAQENPTLSKIDPVRPMNGEATTTTSSNRATDYLKPAPQTSPTISATTSKEVKPGELQKVKTDHAQSLATTQTAAGHSDNKLKQEAQGISSMGSNEVKPGEQQKLKTDHAQSPATTQTAAGHSDNKMKQEVQGIGSMGSKEVKPGEQQKVKTDHAQSPAATQTAAGHSDNKMKQQAQGPTFGHTIGADTGYQAEPSIAAHGGTTVGHSTGGDERHEKSASAAHGGPTAGHATGGDERHQAKSTPAVSGGPTAGHADRDEPLVKSPDAAHGGPTTGQTSGGDGPHPAKAIAAVDGGPTPGKTAGGNGSHAKSSGAVQGGPASGHTTGGDELQAKAIVDQKSTGDGYRQDNGSADANAN